LTGLDLSVLQIKTKIVSSHAADSKPVKQEVNGTVILPPLVFPGQGIKTAVIFSGLKHKHVFTFLFGFLTLRKPGKKLLIFFFF